MWNLWNDQYIFIQQKTIFQHCNYPFIILVMIHFDSELSRTQQKIQNKRFDLRLAPSIQYKY